MPVLQRDETLVLEALQFHELAEFDHFRIGGGEHRAALLVAEQVRAVAEIAGQLGLEHAAILVDERIAIVGQVDEAGDMAPVDDGGRSAVDVDG